ncbi:MAG: Rid family detoxifying hydrolase [Bacteroidales bacterium]
MKKLFILPLLLLFALTQCKVESDQAPVVKKVVKFENTPEKRPYSPAIEAGNMLFVSGQIAVDQSTGKLVEGGIEEQTRQVLKNLKNVIEKGGYTMENVTKCTVLLADISFYSQVNQIYMEFFPKDPPARMAFAVKDLPMGALIEIDAIAVK